MQKFRLGRILGALVVPIKSRLLGPVVLEVVDGVAVDVLHQVLRHHLLEEVPLVALSRQEALRRASYDMGGPKGTQRAPKKTINAKNVSLTYTVYSLEESQK